MRLSVMPITGCLGKNMVKNQQFTPTCSPDDSPEIPPLLPNFKLRIFLGLQIQPPPITPPPPYPVTSNLELFWDFRLGHLKSPPTPLLQT